MATCLHKVICGENIRRVLSTHYSWSLAVTLLLCLFAQGTVEGSGSQTCNDVRVELPFLTPERFIKIPGFNKVIVVTDTYFSQRDSLSLDVIPGQFVNLGEKITGLDFYSGAPSGPFLGVITTENASAAGYDPDTRTVTWTESFRRQYCLSDSMTADPLIHGAEEASTAFISTYSGRSLAYLGTNYQCGTLIRNRVYAVDAATGATEFVFNLDGLYEMDAVVGMAVDKANDVLYVVTHQRLSPFQHSIWAINVLDGTLAWSRSGGTHGRSRQADASPKLEDGRLYDRNWDNVVTAYDATSGEIIWDFEADGLGTGRNVVITRAPNNDLLVAIASNYGPVVVIKDIGDHAMLVSQFDSTGDMHDFGSALAFHPETADLLVGARNAGTIYHFAYDTWALENSYFLEHSAGYIDSINIEVPGHSVPEPSMYVMSASEPWVGRFCINSRLDHSSGFE